MKSMASEDTRCWLSGVTNRVHALRECLRRGREGGTGRAESLEAQGRRAPAARRPAGRAQAQRGRLESLQSAALQLCSPPDQRLQLRAGPGWEAGGSAGAAHTEREAGRKEGSSPPDERLQLRVQLQAILIQVGKERVGAQHLRGRREEQGRMCRCAGRQAGGQARAAAASELPGASPPRAKPRPAGVSRRL